MTDPLRAALLFEPCRDFDRPSSCYTNDGTGLWCEPCTARRNELAADTARPDWPTLANIIREVDGNHDLGAGELAQRIIEHPRFARPGLGDGAHVRDRS